MQWFIRRAESTENHIKTVRYFLRGTRILLEKKQWGINFRQTFVLGIRTSYHLKSECTTINKLDTNELFSAPNTDAFFPIDLIVPVYNGFEYLDNLFTSIKENTDLDYQLFVVNDASPDERVSPLLKKYLRIFGDKMHLIENEHNLGFLKSVNLALQKTKNHVVLINTDVILPKNWASRLLFPIKQDPKVASVTPFSNCATIFSIPNIGDNTFNGDLESVNQSLSRLNAPFNKLRFPTGVGFCMAMNQKAIAKVGYFDEIFERGYGEENDWCQRAIKKGFYNTIAANLFVWHKHGASFGAEKFKMIERHLGIINGRYKNYAKDVKKIQTNETYLALRGFANILYLNSIAKNTFVWFNHTWGGGAEMYAQSKIKTLCQDSLCITFYGTISGYVRMAWQYKDYSGTLYIEHDDIKNIAKNLKISSIIINSLASWTDIPATLHLIAEIKKLTQCDVSFRAHDFMPMCPSICMINHNCSYCAIASLKQCEHCALNLSKQQIKIKNLKEYQSAWGNFFSDTCNEIIVFSDSSRKIFSTLYPQTKDKIRVIPHQPISILRHPVIPKHNGINIGILGAIHEAKGLNLLVQLDTLLKHYKNVTITIIGYTSKQCRLKRITQTGKYTRENLPEMIEQHNIDIIFIPSICPETFSYTTQEAIELGIKCACFNLGGQADQVQKYSKGLIIDKIDAEYALNEVITFCNT